MAALLIHPPGRALHGSLRPPGSKSITNRLLLLAALSPGCSHLTGALKSDDTAYMARALRAMGVQIDEPDDTSFVVTSTGRLNRPDADLFLGNAGTAVRFLTAACALVDGPVTLDGDAHMRRRPIQPLTAALARLGIRAETETGCPPVKVFGTGTFKGGRVEIDAGLSSQYVSAILMAAPRAESVVDVVLTGHDIGARGYVDLTLAAMKTFGIDHTMPDAGCWRITPGTYKACDAFIEPDASAATYLWAAGALTGGRVDPGVPTRSFTQPDAAAADLIAAFPRLPPVIDGSQIQDAVPTLAVVAAFCAEPVRFTGIANLRVKECDRITALARGLNQIRTGLGREDGNDLIVSGDPSLIGATCPARIDTFSDHRIAMSFALAGLLVHGIRILDPACVAKTYPGFWNDLASLGVALTAE